MKHTLIDFLFGVCRIRARGTFCERILNIAKENGIFIRDIISEDENTIVFSVSYRAAQLLSNLNLPKDLSFEIVSTRGLKSIWSSPRKRNLLLFAPMIVFLLLFLSTQIIWHVNIVGATGEKEEYLLCELKKLGVKRGAFKFTINQSDVKNTMLIQNPDLLWLWVDIRGSSAIVKYVDRTPSPEIFDEDSFYNIYSTRDAVITRLIPTNGNAVVNVGDTVLKGQILIEGSMALDEENKKYIHASGEVFGLVWEEKTLTIPKKNEIRTPTGRKCEKLSINFENFRLNLYINSSILYPNYDIIENNRSFVPFGITFTKHEYAEVEVSYEDNHIPLLQKQHEDEFYLALTKKGFTINHTESFITDNGESVTLTMRALCEEPIAQERRMNIGENYSLTDN